LPGLRKHAAGTVHSAGDLEALKRPVHLENLFWRGETRPGGMDFGSMPASGAGSPTSSQDSTGGENATLVWSRPKNDSGLPWKASEGHQIGGPSAQAPAEAAPLLEGRAEPHRPDVAVSALSNPRPLRLPLLF